MKRAKSIATEGEKERKKARNDKRVSVFSEIVTILFLMYSRDVCQRNAAESLNTRTIHQRFIELIQ
jgi:hypothetical protein